MDFGLWSLDFFYGLRMTKHYQLDHLLLSLRLLKSFSENVLLEHGDLDTPQVLGLLLGLGL